MEASAAVPVRARFHCKPMSFYARTGGTLWGFCTCGFIAPPIECPSAALTMLVVSADGHSIGGAKNPQVQKPQIVPPVLV